MDSNAIRAVMIQAVTIIGRDGTARTFAASARRTRERGSSFDQKASSKQASAGTTVNQLRKERLPLSIRMICRTMITTPAIWRASRGQKTNQGATSSASQLYQTPNLSTRRGRKWNHLLSGPGRGWVSK